MVNYINKTYVNIMLLLCDECGNQMFRSIVKGIKSKIGC